jgi:dephospho-CoA kinase
MQVIGTVGLPGSGKGEAATVAHEEGIPVVTMGDVVRRATRERGLDPAEHHGEVATALREEEGPAAIAERSLPLIREAVAEAGDDVDTVLVDGLRSLVEVECFEDEFGADFRIVSVEAPFETRAERLGARGRDASDADLQALRDREERELGFGMGEVMDRADVVVDNAGDLEPFRERVRTLLRDGPGALVDDEGVNLRDGLGSGSESESESDSTSGSGSGSDRATDAGGQEEREREQHAE